MVDRLGGDGCRWCMGRKDRLPGFLGGRRAVWTLVGSLGVLVCLQGCATVATQAPKASVAGSDGFFVFHAQGCKGNTFETANVAVRLHQGSVRAPEAGTGVRELFHRHLVGDIGVLRPESRQPHHNHHRHHHNTGSLRVARAVPICAEKRTNAVRKNEAVVAGDGGAMQAGENHYVLVSDFVV